MMGNISAPIMCSGDTVGILHHKETWPRWYIVWNFGRF